MCTPNSRQRCDVMVSRRHADKAGRQSSTFLSPLEHQTFLPDGLSPAPIVSPCNSARMIETGDVQGKAQSLSLFHLPPIKPPRRDPLLPHAAGTVGRHGQDSETRSLPQHEKNKDPIPTTQAIGRSVVGDTRGSRKRTLARIATRHEAHVTESVHQPANRSHVLFGPSPTGDFRASLGTDRSAFPRQLPSGRPPRSPRVTGITPHHTLIAASLASAPELQKKTRSAQLLSTSHLASIPCRPRAKFRGHQGSLMLHDGARIGSASAQETCHDTPRRESLRTDRLPSRGFVSSGSLDRLP